MCPGEERHRPAILSRNDRRGARATTGSFPGLPARSVGVDGQRRSKVFPRTDPELGEHLAQMPFDGARADEQLGADLGVRQSLTGEPGDLGLLCREDLTCLDRPWTHRLAGGLEFAAGPLGESLGTET